MRYVVALIIPLLVQLIGFATVYLTSEGDFFVGFLAMPVAALFIPVLFTIGYLGARSASPLSRVALTMLTIAVIPPALLLLFRLLES